MSIYATVRHSDYFFSRKFLGWYAVFILTIYNNDFLGINICKYTCTFQSNIYTVKDWAFLRCDSLNPHTLTYQIVVAYQISVALGTSLELNNRSLSNNRSLGKVNNKKIAQITQFLKAILINCEYISIFNHNFKAVIIS